MAGNPANSLGTMLAGAEPLEDGFTLDIADDWLQGRTAYGGVTSAIALAVARTVDPQLPPLRSGQLAMIAPLAGRVEARARIVRKGRNATWVAAELSNERGIGFSASFVFMRPAESALKLDGYPIPEGIAPIDTALPVPMDHAPIFLRTHFETRFALPPAPTGTADLCWWVRLRDRTGLHPEVEAMLCGDALPTAVWPLLSFTVPISSMHWHVNALGAAPSADGWWLIRSTSEFARNGSASEHIMQWNGEGVPAIAGMQSVAVFG